MVTNVSEKDKTLQAVIDWCKQLETEGRRLAYALLLQHDRGAYGAVIGQVNAYGKIATTAVPCSAPCRPRCLIKARMRNERRGS